MKLMRLLALLKEAELDTPSQVMQKAEIAKIRADKKQLGVKQKQLGQSRKNSPDRITKSRKSKEIADIGSKKADLGIKLADLSKKIKKPTEVR